jgi:hypothetical protein
VLDWKSGSYTDDFSLNNVGARPAGEFAIAGNDAKQESALIRFVLDWRGCFFERVWWVGVLQTFMGMLKTCP